jgi:hypothetical protein
MHSNLNRPKVVLHTVSVACACVLCDRKFIPILPQMHAAFSLLSENSLRWCKFLGAFPKLRKATVSFVMSGPLSFRTHSRMEQLGSLRTDFYDNWYTNFFRKSFERIKVSLKSNKKMGTLHENQYVFLPYLAPLLL